MDNKTEDNNIVLAKFVGAEVDVRENLSIILHFDDVEDSFKPPKIIWCSAIDTLYHSSWDWLLPIYSKVTTLIWDSNKLNLDDIGCAELLNEFHIRVMRDAPNEASCICVNLINWYKNNKLKQ